MAKMGLQFGLQDGQYCKRQHHWMFVVDGIIGDTTAINALPPSKASRPHITFTEINVRHLIEDVFIPGKPDWKPITITVFDLVKNKNPIWDWITTFYNPGLGKLVAPNYSPVAPNSKAGINEGFFRQCQLQMFDGCGIQNELWTYEDAWPQQINFQTLDYGQQDVMMADITLRYARAYIGQPTAQG